MQQKDCNESNCQRLLRAIYQIIHELLFCLKKYLRGLVTRLKKNRKIESLKLCTPIIFLCANMKF